MTRSLFAVPLATAVAALTFGAAAPAMAGSETCANAPAALRAAAASVDANAARNALRHVATGEKLCEARNDVGAARKFKVAAKLLKVDYASLTAPTAAAK